ncbi:hypothetical protein EDD86DRAFT_65232 [Gorgonomyces haynaldii]|nr:hypothetical protein EDD86DRAFT_65232 [Gorgonomyces haynaldii]
MSKRTKAPVERLIDWALKNGAHIQGMEYNPDLEGMVATQDLTNCRISIPKQLLLSESVCLDSDIGKKVHLFCKQHHSSDFMDLDKRNSLDMVVMVCFMVHERNVGGFFSPYLEALPKTHDLPVCWSRDEIQRFLGGTTLCQLSLDRKDWIEKMTTIVKKVMPEMTQRDFEWGFCNILSRAFPRAAGTGDDWITLAEMCLFPVLDLLNHKREAKIKWLLNDSVEFQLEENYNKGQEVFNNYGHKGNENLLSNYGFVLTDNPEDYFKVKMAFEQDPLFERKQSILKDRNLQPVLTLFVDEPVFNPKALETVRIIVAKEHELLNDQISVRNERSALLTLLRLLELKLKGLQVEDTDTSKRYMLAKVFRDGQIKIIQQSIQHLNNMLSEISQHPEQWFLWLGSPKIDQTWLETAREVVFDQEILLLLIVTKHLDWFPQLIGEQDIEDMYQEEIEPLLGNDLFPSDLFTLERVKQACTLMDLQSGPPPDGVEDGLYLS